MTHLQVYQLQTTEFSKILILRNPKIKCTDKELSGYNTAEVEWDIWDTNNMNTKLNYLMTYLKRNTKFQLSQKLWHDKSIEGLFFSPYIKISSYVHIFLPSGCVEPFHCNYKGQLDRYFAKELCQKCTMLWFWLFNVFYSC